MASKVDSAFGFLDKHLKEVGIFIGCLLLYRLVKNNTPTEGEKKEQQEEAARQNVNDRLIPPPPPAKDTDGNISKKDEVAHNAAMKAHRSAQLAQLAANAMEGMGTDEDALFDIAMKAALWRITFAQLSADYWALQDAGITKYRAYKTTLAVDLKDELSTTDYMKFMKLIGMSVKEANAMYQKGGVKK